MPTKRNNKRNLVILVLLLVCGFFLYFVLPKFLGVIKYSSGQNSPSTNKEEIKDSIKSAEVLPENNNVGQNLSIIAVTHIKTPEVVKAAYISAWVAGSSKYRDPIVKLIDDTELNSIVIDVKDSTGRISFAVSDPMLAREKSSENRISNIRAITNLLHQKNIYIIGRISVFQDPFMALKRPEWAIAKKSDGKVWKDRKGLSFLDPANKDVWKYVVSIANEAYADGFDEINFDYIRYPSDGNIKDINYHIAEGKTRADNIESFFKYLNTEVKKNEGVAMSADLFGLTTEVNDDMGIGQVWEKAIPYFDFIAPMVYPSHYPSGHMGFKNPAEHPYEVVNKALLGAIKKTKAMQGQDIHKIRPWLQDFNLGATYDSAKVQAQIKAVKDNNLNSWMLWDPNNKYTRGALLLETNQ